MYIMPHPLDRKYQAETYSKIKSSQQPFTIIQSPTGSGKSAWAAQLAADGYKVLVLVKTKSLQAQYAENYGFSLLYGKNNYTCLNRKLQDEMLFLDQRNDYEIPTADLCDCEDKNWCRANCPYPQARQEFIEAQAGVLNYSKFLLDKNLIEQFSPDYLILDECHELSDTTVDYAGIEFNWSSWIKEYIQPYFINSPQNIAFYQGKEFLQQFRENLNYNKPVLPKNGGSVKKYRFWENTLGKVNNALSLMSSSEVWYITSDHERFLAKPLTARFDFTSLFNLAPRIVLMSATIGQPRLYCRELGIEQFSFIDVKNIWPAFTRPIYDYQSVKITGKSSYQERKEHAQVIASIFNNKPGEWNGLVHVTSKDMARELGSFIQDMTKRPVWTPTSGLGTEEALSDWEVFNQNNQGAVAVYWQFFAGVDLGNININISARTPYPDFGDAFGKARFNFDKSAARVRVANTFEQQQGRNRRGYAEHYGPAARKMNCITDSKWTRLKSALNKDFLAAVKQV